MLYLARAIVEVLSDLIKLAVLFLRPASAIRAENLALRRQLAAYIERGIRPRRLDHASRGSLSVLAGLFSWRDAIVSVRPSTVIRWHRLGWRIFWRWKSRAGRPQIQPELERLIHRMAAENPLWGEERIANELLVKLGIGVSPRTVRKYMPGRPRGLVGAKPCHRLTAGAFVRVKSVLSGLHHEYSLRSNDLCRARSVQIFERSYQAASR